MSDVTKREPTTAENLDLVRWLVWKYKMRPPRHCRGWMDTVDVLQIGALGLLRAERKRNPNLGFKYSTWAGACIRHAILKAFAREQTEKRCPKARIETDIDLDTIPSPCEDPSDAAEAREEILALEEAIENLVDQRGKRAVRMRIEGMTHRAIAEAC